ncbi:hypothetical protein GEV29_10690 [Aeromicrobium sp. SMF47]|uniref:Uncharacterized protein n=1 Tax=Aeromicrobium yanjiei TaxID=2662028 RepID=A0A5Q2ML95_9ACTN|nr:MULTISPECIES: hypothetical protein [Aeromicrobium]MRJ77007.1 hypothetical protein [Aeromicrobium yanjiei]MRK01349.1 hypothetical protein [Aeromicrobium sp. S22]QGG41876.1 hypothetical protein GEV26_11135 [Aeromicrobium yanjiei]
MPDTEELPPYPPARDAWQFPPPPVHRRWKWVAISAGALALAAAVFLITAVVELEGRDAPGLIEDEELVSIIDRECELMSSTVASMPVTGTPREQGQTIIDQNLAISRMLSAIEGRAGDRIDADRPARMWLDDWTTLVDARNRYVLAELEDGSARFRVPRDPDGHPLPERMNDAFLDDGTCAVPKALLSPYPAGRTADV